MISRSPLCSSLFSTRAPAALNPVAQLFGVVAGEGHNRAAQAQRVVAAAPGPPQKSGTRRWHRPPSRRRR
jgi:hypothetical protein